MILLYHITSKIINGHIGKMV